VHTTPARVTISVIPPISKRQMHIRNKLTELDRYSNLNTAI
jgi:hypothetical protein